MGSIESYRSKSPLTSIVCSDELMAPKLDLVDQETSLLKFLKESEKELQNTLTDDNSTLINICNPARAINIVTLYLSHFLGLNVDNIITNYVYDPRQTFVYPGNVSNSPTPVAAVPNLKQAFWTIVSQVRSSFLNFFLHLGNMRTTQKYTGSSFTVSLWILENFERFSKKSVAKSQFLWNWLFATDSDFLISISLQPNSVDL